MKFRHRVGLFMVISGLVTVNYAPSFSWKVVDMTIYLIGACLLIKE